MQAKLAEHTQGSKERSRVAAPSLLAGRIVEDDGQPLIATHSITTRGGSARRYRYYVSRALHHGTTSEGLRLPARALEALVVQRLASALDDPLTLVADVGVDLTTEAWARLDARAGVLAATLRDTPRPLVLALVAQVKIEGEAIVILVDAAALAERLGGTVGQGAPPLRLTTPATVRRSGRATRLVHAGVPLRAAGDHGALPRLVAQGHVWWAELRKGELDVTRLAEREQRAPGYITRVVRLAFLSPEVTRAILAGQQREGVDVGALTLRLTLPGKWSGQATMLLPAA